MLPSEFVEILEGIGLLGSLGLTGAKAICASLCFVEIPEGTLAVIPEGALVGITGDSMRVSRVLVKRRGIFGRIVGLGFALPALDEEVKKDDLCSGAGMMISSDESTENKDDGESGRTSSTTLSFP